MTRQELEKRRERAKTETFVIAQTEGGYRIHSPTSGGGPYQVDPGVPSCTCMDFQRHRNDSEWRCKHVLAVWERYGRPAEDDEYEREERAAIQAESRMSAGEPPPPLNGAAPRMLLKRSVSPDGRIDSLSVEFSCPVDLGDQGVQTRALGILEAQDDIVRTFLKRTNGSRPAERSQRPRAPQTPDDPEPNGALPAQLVRIGGADGKWGRRLFLTVQANGRALRLYGSQTKLAEHLSAAGYADEASDVREGLSLNLPCCILTTESDDGFVRVEKVLPPRRIH